MTIHCTASREQNGNKIYYTNLRKVLKERSVINLYWNILKCFAGNIFPDYHFGLAASLLDQRVLRVGPSQLINL